MDSEGYASLRVHVEGAIRLEEKLRMKKELLHVENLEPGDSVVLAKGDRIKMTNRRPKLFGLFKVPDAQFILEVTNIVVTEGVPMVRLDVLESGI